VKRHLTLRSEHLAELSTNDLASVAGGTTTDLFTGNYPSLNAPCTRLLSPLTPVIDLPATTACG
jgi:hypothetical protein